MEEEKEEEEEGGGEGDGERGVWWRHKHFIFFWKIRFTSSNGA